MIPPRANPLPPHIAATSVGQPRPDFPPCVIAAVQDGDVTSPYKYRRASAPHFPTVFSVRQPPPRPRLLRPKIVPKPRSEAPYRFRGRLGVKSRLTSRCARTDIPMGWRDHVCEPTTKKLAFSPLSPSKSAPKTTSRQTFETGCVLDVVCVLCMGDLRAVFGCLLPSGMAGTPALRSDRVTASVL
ncbi:hypothetical protein Bbelb_247990 [Branchiostoma belcheri]|nr:hypothetical protein Bbelb_247990 [Branchiostoma belcheri]